MKRVLVADDEEHISSLISDCLKTDGYDVVCADNGLLAFHLLQDAAYDLLITDIVMPDMDGLELIRKTKNFMRSWFQQNLVLMSGIKLIRRR